MKCHYAMNVGLLALVATGNSALVKSASAQITAWGSNQAGQCTVPQTHGGIVQLAAGGSHSAALNRHGGLVMWGENGHGQLNVPPDTRIQAIALGDAHTVALVANTHSSPVVCWGANQYGQCNAPSWLPDAVAVAAGANHSMALTASGHVHVWGTESWVPDVVQGRVVAIDGGWNHSLAVLSDGTVGAWGDNWAGQTSVPKNLSGAVAVAAGHYFSLALTASGSVRGWGFNYFGVCEPPPDATGVTRIDAGMHHAIALRSDGRVVAWGLNDQGQAAPPWKAATGGNQGLIAAGASHGLCAPPPMPPGPPSGDWVERTVAPSPNMALPTLQQAIDSTPPNVKLRLRLVAGTYRGTGDAIAIAVDRTIELYAAHGAGSAVIDGENARRGILHVGTGAHSLIVRDINFTRCRGGPTAFPLPMPSAGGAITTFGGTGLDVSRCGFSDCNRPTPTEASYAGSAIYYPWVAGYGYGSNPGPVRVADCTVDRCESSAFVLAARESEVTRCTFRNCRFGMGAALLAVNCRIEACTFEANRDAQWGGAVFLSYSDRPSHVNNCVFIGNSAVRGGAIGDWRLPFPSKARSTITNSAFIGNFTTGNGGGGALAWCQATDIDGCTFIGNEGLFGRAAQIYRKWPARFSNCTFDTCCPVWPADAVDWGPGNEFDERCIDCAGDIECDGLVDGVDLGIMLSRWGPAAKGDVADINLDGAVDGVDLGLLLATWGVCPQG